MDGNKYAPDDMAQRWQERWRESDVFATTFDPDKPRFYGYEYPPFPSGSLHMGHVRNYVIGDTLARYKRLRDYNVLYTQAFDSLGLPVEDAAKKSGQSPAQWLDECIARMTQELLGLGLSYDRAKIYSYHEPAYYKWTQWIFLKLFEAGAIYRSQNWSDWCDSCETALAAELLDDGCCWRCGTAAIKAHQAQWYIDVHSIARDLIDGLETYDYPPVAKVQQRNWIGSTQGLFVDFKVEGMGKPIEVFTTQVNAIYGTTFIGLAPEHPWLPDLIKGTENEASILSIIQETCTAPRVERMKTPGREGAFLQRQAVHPLTGEPVPICVVPFVQAEFGTGAILGCPAHDANSLRFAEAMQIQVKPVIAPDGGDIHDANVAYLGAGHLIESGEYSGMDTTSAEIAITDDLVAQGVARKGETFRVRDWCISRQRYWSAPIPIVYCDDCGTVPVPESNLPVILPTEGVKLDVGGNPLEHHEEFVSVACPSCGRLARRETSTLDTFVNSSWSYMRNCNPDYNQGLFDPEAVGRWVPCEFDIGGTENVTVANFYFRVILHWLHRLGLTEGAEPFKSSIFHGMVLMDGRKMSKSIGNIVQPSELIDRYGVDSVRFQSMWAARPDNDYNWSDEKAATARRFLQGVWYASIEIIEVINTVPFDGVDADKMTTANRKFARVMQIGRRKIETSYDGVELQAVCNGLILLWSKLKKFWDRIQNNPTPENICLLDRALREFLIMLNPIAPHITEELWARLGQSKMLAAKAHWPGDKNAR